MIKLLKPFIMVTAFFITLTEKLSRKILVSLRTKWLASKANLSIKLSFNYSIIYISSYVLFFSSFQ